MHHVGNCTIYYYVLLYYYLNFSDVDYIKFLSQCNIILSKLWLVMLGSSVLLP